jgi:hypothetical protein
VQRFLIEREIEGASELTEAQLAAIADTSNQAVASLGVPYNWVTSYVAGNKVYCVHETDNAETIFEHARRGGFPANLGTRRNCWQTTPKSRWWCLPPTVRACLLIP